MITKRKDPEEDVLNTSKPIIEAPVFPEQTNVTPANHLPSIDADLVRDNNDDAVDYTADEIDVVPLDNLDEDEADWDR